jgi:hypothetical protein
LALSSCPRPFLIRASAPTIVIFLTRMRNIAPATTWVRPLRLHNVGLLRVITLTHTRPHFGAPGPDHYITMKYSCRDEDGSAGDHRTKLSLRFRRSSFKLVQIGVAGRTTQRTTHSNDLAFVMKGMGQDMMKDERRSADGDVPIGEMKFRISVELLIGQVRQISVGPPADFLLQESHIGDGRAFLRVPVGVPQPLERVNPKPFAVENMNCLFTQRAESEAW